MTRARTSRRRCPAAAGAVAAHLEHRRDVERALERAGHGGAQHGEPPRAPRGAAVGPAALGLGQPTGVLGQHRDQARRERGGERRRADETRRQRAEQLVGVGGADDEQAGEVDDQQPQRDHEAVDERLDGEVDLSEHSPVAEPGEHGQPVAVDEQVDDHGERSGAAGR